MHNNNDLSQLSRTGKICKRARLVFEKIRDEIIQEFGVSPEFLAIHRANINLELLQSEFMRTKDRTLIFEIEMEEKILSDLIKPMQMVNNLYDSMVWVKRQQISFDENKVTTFWFLKYMDHLMKQIKKSNVGK